jgi:hypothetical protein
MMTIITSLILLISFYEGFSQLENTYTDEKCGISIQYPEDWTVEDSDIAVKDLKTLATFSPEDDFLLFGVYIEIENFGLYKKSMEGVSEFQKDLATYALPESTIIESIVTEINGFPTHKMVYTMGTGDRILTYLIIAYDREYLLTFEAADKEEFDKYSSTVEEMANSIKISKPNFEGTNC